MIGLTYEEFLALEPCDPAETRVVELLGGVEKWRGVSVTAAEARVAGCTLFDLLWVVSEVAQQRPDIERRLRLLLADYAAHVLHFYEEKGKSNAPRLAITATRQFARGEINDVVLAGCSALVFEAATTAFYATGAANYAAHAAYYAVRVVAREAAAYAAEAAVPDAEAAYPTLEAAANSRDAEQAWQFDRLIARLSDDEPEDWPLPARAS